MGGGAETACRLRAMVGDDRRGDGESTNLLMMSLQGDSKLWVGEIIGLNK